jgi:hypothetical protein
VDGADREHGVHLAVIGVERLYRNATSVPEAGSVPSATEVAAGRSSLNEHD